MIYQSPEPGSLTSLQLPFTAGHIHILKNSAAQFAAEKPIPSLSVLLGGVEGTTSELDYGEVIISRVGAYATWPLPFVEGTFDQRLVHFAPYVAMKMLANSMNQEVSTTVIEEMWESLLINHTELFVRINDSASKSSEILIQILSNLAPYFVYSNKRENLKLLVTVPYSSLGSNIVYFPVYGYRKPEIKPGIKVTDERIELNEPSVPLSILIRSFGAGFVFPRLELCELRQEELVRTFALALFNCSTGIHHLQYSFSAFGQ